MNGKKQTHVTQGKWSVSSKSGTEIEGHVLCVFRPRGNKTAYGDHHGRVFETGEAVREFCLAHGYTTLYFTSPSLRARRVARAGAVA